jgi:hypothetical protein
MTISNCLCVYVYVRGACMWMRVSACMFLSNFPSNRHFLHHPPYTELLPEKRMLFSPNLPKMVGSDPLAARLRQMKPDLHVFGHTHLGWDAVVDGIRFVQAPLGYPAERKRGMVKTMEPLCVYDDSPQPSSAPGFVPYPLPFRWSTHYRNNARDPNNLELAPWVAKRYI